jgi:concentrative nucleoside transporter, CNT family
VTILILRALLGVVCLLGLLWLFSLNRKAINWRLIGGGLLLQLLLAFAFFGAPEYTNRIIEPIATFFVRITDFSMDGAQLVFGKLIDIPTMEKVLGPESGFLFAFRVLPTIIFFSALTSALYYLGILQRIVFVFAWVMKRMMRLSGAESLAVAGEVFLGQTESALLVKPYLPKMTRSEIAAMMIGGMGTIAGGVMAAYIAKLGGTSEPERIKFGTWLLCASIMNAPACIVAAKILVPETEPINEDLTVPKEKTGANFFDALAAGTSEGLQLCLNVGAMLISFVAFAALANWVLAGIGSVIPVGGGWALNDWIAAKSGNVFSGLSLQSIFGSLMTPIAWLMGVDSADLLRTGQLLGTKLALNEYVAYDQLGTLKQAAAMSPRTVFLCTFALCGFANLGSIGIQLGGMAVLAPEKRPVLAGLGIRALIGGTIASILTATIAGVFYQG